MARRQLIARSVRRQFQLVDRKQISESEFNEFVSRFLGRRVGEVWFGDYSVMYLEFGKKVNPETSPMEQEREHGAFLGYDWELVLPAGHTVRRLDQGAEAEATDALTGTGIESVRFSRSQDIILSFVGGAVLRSVSVQGGDPDWDLREFRHCYVSRRGTSFTLESPSPKATA